MPVQKKLCCLDHWMDYLNSLYTPDQVEKITKVAGCIPNFWAPLGPDIIEVILSRLWEKAQKEQAFRDECKRYGLNVAPD